MRRGTSGADGVVVDRERGSVNDTAPDSREIRECIFTREYGKGIGCHEECRGMDGFVFL